MPQWGLNGGPSICPPLIKFKALPKQAMFSGAAAGPSGEHSGDDQSALGLFLIRMRLSSCNRLFRMSFVVKSETPQTETLFSSVVRAPPGEHYGYNLIEVCSNPLLAQFACTHAFSRIWIEYIENSLKLYKPRSIERKKQANAMTFKQW